MSYSSTPPFYFYNLNKAVQTDWSGEYSSDLSGTLSLPGIKNGENVPKRRAKIRAGEQAGSYYKRDVYDVIIIDGNASLSYYNTSTPSHWYVQTFNGCSNPPSVLNHLTTIPDSVKATALNKIYDRIRSNQTGVGGLLILAELRKTLHMLRHPASALTKQVTDYIALLEKRKKGVAKLPVRLRRDAWSNTVTGTYLEIVFGIMPTLSDMKDILKTIKRIQDGDPQKSRLTGRASISDKLDTPPSPLTFLPSTFMQGRFNALHTETVHGIKYTVGFDTRASTGYVGLNRLVELAGFNPSEFIPTIYEVMPFSWAIDYFSNLGNLLRAGTLSTSQIRWIVEDSRQRTVVFNRSERSPYNSEQSWLSSQGYTMTSRLDGDFGSHQTVRTSLERKILTEFPSMPFVFTHPGDNIKHILNLIAVANSLRLSNRNLHWLHSQKV